ncbi:MAG: hypothetical protein LKK50_06255 [Prevotella sp.]|jgi:hypothetical protein|nr:hypothetical protein [Prevotella sp.]MCI1685932.1 hypothetical protein [Prevotella sp.]MCI1781417.1 hypothetical protein [Prevotella sp.]MCI1802209.1 hypothetical protein [Prevotella sp.]MCI1816159.1 hypothetical protein [Prevotella sp.]MCI1848560.1 hypothetical protein [Prevotella sp.]
MMKFNIFHPLRFPLHQAPLYGLVLFAGLLAAGCSASHAGDKKQLKADADSFATFYFNWQFRKAIPFCTSGSQKWLRYAASNVHTTDLPVLRGKTDGASCHIHKIKFVNDSAAEVILTVNDYVCMDTIGKSGRVVSHAQFRLPMIFQNHKWKVKMEDLPRSEKPDHD